MHAHTHVFSRVKELIYGSWCWDLKPGLTDNSFDRFYHILWFLKWFRLFQVMKCGHRWPQSLCLISILVYKKFDYLFPLRFPLFSNNRSKLLYMFMIEVKKKKHVFFLWIRKFPCLVYKDTRAKFWLEFSWIMLKENWRY